ncbi:MAG: protein translocase subunit SecD [Anaerovoracaceae bacterium]
MNYNLRRVLAVVIIVLIAFGWYVTIFGLGSVMEPTKDKIKLGLDIKGGVYVVMEAKTKETGEELRKLMEQTQAVIETRVNQMGLAEPVVTIEGTNRIRIELPGAEDAEEAIKQIGKTAQLQFILADGTKILDGGNVKNAGTSTDNDQGGYAVDLQFDNEGGKLFEEGTSKAYAGTVKPKIDSIPANAIAILLDDEIISVASVKDGPISGGSCNITGSFGQDEAKNLAALIRGGALPVALEEVTSSSQTAKIGFNALEQSIFAALIGLVLVFIIMLVGYHIMGLAANIALLLYVVIILTVMALMGSVLTLPGIAGIILSIGMAVDANVIIFSRIKEEICGGKSIRVAVQTGFKRAMSTVMDSQITTFIAAIILYQVGTSSVKGFAWTLMIGIVTSIFTAVVITQLYVGLIAESKIFGHKKFFGIKEDGTASFSIKKDLHFVRHRKIFYIITIGILLVGLCFGLVKGLNYGIDFTGGTMIQMDLGKQVPAKDVAKTIEEYNLDPEIIYSGDKNQEVVIRTMKALDAGDRGDVIATMEKEYKVTDDAVVAQELFGPSVGKELRNKAIQAILLSALCMLVYIRIRFSQWKFGGSALLGVLNDVLIMMSFYAIFQVPVNNPFIAGILTVVGYSINDTIVVFDRIRENNKFSRKSDIEAIIDSSVTQTLGRSLMTSFTTLIVMIPLFILTGPAIREFTLPLMIGVIAGALSSITVCSPLYYEFSLLGNKSKYDKHRKKKTSSKKKDK